MPKKDKLPQRDEISTEHKWNLEDIYASEKDWEEDLKKAKEDLQAITGFKGKLTTGEELLSCLKLHDQLGILLGKVVGYAMMRKDEDNTNSKFQEFADKAMTLAIEANSALSFISPEILALPSDKVRGWLENVKGLEIYKHYIEDILRTKPHTLPAEQEELLANTSEMAQAPGNIFTMFNNADLKFPSIVDDKGDEIELTHGRYITFLESKDRRVRKDAFQAMYNTYSQWKNTLATTYTAAVKKSAFFAKTRKYDSTLMAALDSDNVKPEVYDNLIKTIHNHLPLFYRYVALRKNLLELDELHMYDLFAPVVKEVEMKIPYQEAIEMLKTGLKPLGDEYLKDLKKGLNEGWVDWFENQGKTSGAYSRGTYSVHPYVLMNYQDNVNNMFTLAHEMGHAMHSFYSDQNQEYINSHYTIFVAEVASTVNESLVMADLLKKTTDKQKKMYLLNYHLEQFRGTIFRQTMFAEFEKVVHGKIENGQPMTPESLSQLYYQLNEKYYGPGIVIDDEIAMEWARIPHFYRPFYVYKYATGFSAAVALSRQILVEEQPAVDRYLEFLKSGGSDYPINLLKKAGVDMSSSKPIEDAMSVFESLLKEMESLAKS